MRIIIEGPDGVGKTTVVQALADAYGCDILHHTELGSKRPLDYHKKAQLGNMIFDRSFLSEIAYSIVFNRECNLTPTQVEELMRDYKTNCWQIVILDADTDTIVKRLNLRADEAEYKIRKISELRMVYRALAYFFNLKIIDNTHFDIDEFIKKLEE